MSNKSKIEICANSVESAVKAQQGGAYRVELCAGIPEGGTTPSFGEIRMARQLLQQTKLHIIIRPRGGDFLYSPIEQEIMLHDIKVARQLGADGVVFGCLTAEGYVDVPLMQKLMNAVGEMSVTFHRAFDMCSNPKEALEQIIGLGIDRVLTSGQEATAEKGIPLLKELGEQADGPGDRPPAARNVPDDERHVGLQDHRPRLQIDEDADPLPRAGCGPQREPAAQHRSPTRSARRASSAGRRPRCGTTVCSTLWTAGPRAWPCRSARC